MSGPAVALLRTNGFSQQLTLRPLRGILAIEQTPRRLFVVMENYSAREANIFYNACKKLLYFLILVKQLGCYIIILLSNIFFSSYALCSDQKVSFRDRFLQNLDIFAREVSETHADAVFENNGETVYVSPFTGESIKDLNVIVKTNTKYLINTGSVGKNGSIPISQEILEYDEHAKSEYNIVEHDQDNQQWVGLMVFGKRLKNGSLKFLGAAGSNLPPYLRFNNNFMMSIFEKIGYVRFPDRELGVGESFSNNFNQVIPLYDKGYIEAIETRIYTLNTIKDNVAEFMLDCRSHGYVRFYSEKAVFDFSGTCSGNLIYDTKHGIIVEAESVSKIEAVLYLPPPYLGWTMRSKMSDTTSYRETLKTD